MSSDTDRIRMLNDQLRRNLIIGAAVMTPGIARLGSSRVSQLLNAISAFSDFTPDNDPHGEHDFGSLDLDDQKIIFKIDSFDKELKHHSPDPADANVTERVITIMLASEY